MKHSIMLALIGLASAAPAQSQQATQAVSAKSRLLVLTDIEADPDDTQSLIRLLLYANDIDLEGLVATTSVHQKNKVVPESIRRVIAEYAKVRPNLLLHDPHYPTADSLDRLVSAGQTIYGMAGVGQGKDTEGARRIIAALDSPDPRPLWVAGWGGPNTLAQALFMLRATRTPADVKRLVAKLRVYTVSDQDDTGPWMRREFPDLFYIVSPGGYGAATWTGINTVVDGLDNGTISNRWLATNIQQGHGSLGAAGAAAISCASRPAPRQTRTGSTAAFRSRRKHGRSGPTRLTPSRHSFPSHLAERSNRPAAAIPGSVRRFGAGAMIFRTTSPRGWPGPLRTGHRQTTRRWSGFPILIS